MVRSTACLLVIVMLLASGRLLACGWECIDELAVPAEASCHQESTPVTAVNGDAAHACLPEVVEPRVTVAKPATAQSLAAAPLVTVIVTHERPAETSRSAIGSYRSRFQLLHPPAPAVLRI